MTSTHRYRRPWLILLMVAGGLLLAAVLPAQTGADRPAEAPVAVIGGERPAEALEAANDIFQRSENLPQKLTTVLAEIRRVVDQFSRLLVASFWSNRLGRALDSERAVFTSAFFLLVVLLFLIYRLKRFCRDFPTFPFFIRRPFLTLSFKIVFQSLLLSGTTFFLYFSIHSYAISSSVPEMSLLADLLWVLLISRWWLAAANLIDPGRSQPLLDRIRPRLQRLTRAVRYFAMAHLVLGWFAGDGSPLLISARMLFGAAMFAWYVRFLGHCREILPPPAAAAASRHSLMAKAPMALGYLVFGTGLVFDFIGYNHLAVYWLASWGKTTAVLLWGALLFSVWREGFQLSQNGAKIENEGDKVSGNPFRWFFLWACWLFWLGGVTVAMIAAWGGRQSVIIAFLRTLNQPIRIGEMHFSPVGFVYAFLVLLLTHAASRLWQRLFHRKFLSRSDIDVGLQETIVSISVYVFWVFGILLALHVVGINTTSLAVGLGALGIGIGFGLQNIFNNFISGIILLFERPIQVGDAIEINGVWAIVQKIKVRSTVVQTWDNASIIIPNSELISSQVTNWSFKDMRLRRTITVGVAYGSDTERVRETLLEIAEKTDGVLKNPKPDVLFSDFGDSALVFKLRIFTLVEGMFGVETNLRFEIDRLFRERNITIAFPQRDVHIHPAPGTAPPSPPGKSGGREELSGEKC